MENNQLANLYKNRFQESVLARKNEIWKVICKNFLQKYIRQTDTVVDVACGYGEFINNINCKHKIGIDLNPDAKNKLNPNITFELAPATELSKFIKNKSDVVFTSNFLEHLPNKNTLDLFMKEVHNSLKPGGKFIILGPNLRYLPGAYWDFYDHHLGLTHLSLTEALRINGFEVVECIDKFLPYTTQGALPTHPYFVWLYLKIPLIWRILGKQFLIIANSIPANK